MSFEKRIEAVDNTETVPLFTGIDSWADLETTIDATPGLRTSSGQPYRLEDLADGLEVARGTRFNNFQGITSSEGLRETVACLLIEEAKNLIELSALLTHIKEISGSSENYSRDKLVQQIQLIVDGEAPPQVLTRAYGLRDTLTRLLQTEMKTAA